MKLEDIYEELCVHDPRNSFYQDMIAAGDLPEDMPPPRIKCFCDSCFRGNDKLALEILRLRETLQAVVDAWKQSTYGDLAALIDHMADPMDAAEKILEEE